MPIAPRRCMAVLFWLCMFLWAAPLAMAQSRGADGEVVVGGVLSMLFMLCCVGIPALAVLGLWIWALVDCLRRDFPGNEKIVWVLVIVLANWIGAIIYLLIGRSKGTLPRDRGGV